MSSRKYTQAGKGRYATLRFGDKGTSRRPINPDIINIGAELTHREMAQAWQQFWTEWQRKTVTEIRNRVPLSGNDIHSNTEASETRESVRNVGLR
jgi:hypothetical protein